MVSLSSVSDLYTFGIFSVSDTLSCFRLFTCLQRQFIFSLLSVYYPYLKPWAVCINFVSVYFGLFSGYFRYMILHLYIFYSIQKGKNIWFSFGIIWFFIWYHLISIESSKFYLIDCLHFFSKCSIGIILNYIYLSIFFHLVSFIYIFSIGIIYIFLFNFNWYHSCNIYWSFFCISIPF